jgi:hypothetical protein
MFPRRQHTTVVCRGGDLNQYQGPGADCLQRPLRSRFRIGPGLEPFAAARYDSKQRPIPFYAFDHPGGSAVYSSAHDLARFGMFHLKNHPLDQ